jgi:hypothetical protein
MKQINKINKIKNDSICKVETISEEENLNFIKKNLEDKKNIPIKDQRLIFNFKNSN